MDKYKFKVALEVSIEAFDESDAWEALEDQFGIGEQQGLVITKCEYKEIRPRGNRK